MGLCLDIFKFIESNGIGCRIEMLGSSEVIVIQSDSCLVKVVLPIEINASDISETERQSREMEDTIGCIVKTCGVYPLIITEDRWEMRKDMMQKRLLAHLEIFVPVYARNCEVRRIGKEEASAFLDACHSYGDAACRYRYGLFVKRHTGHLALSGETDRLLPGTLVAVATFSNARKWIKAGKVIRSYEWTRYASLPEVRVTGGMGRLLRRFIEDVGPDDIMSYADLEWSEGKVYEQLGFKAESRKEPVTFFIDSQWHRRPVKTEATVSGELECRRMFRNFGSRKYRLKLTDYIQTDQDL